MSHAASYLRIEPILLSPSFQFTLLILGLLVLSVTLKTWLVSRQVRRVSLQRHTVPEVFAPHISVQAHERAAAYTLARCQGALLDLAVSTTLFLSLTLFGGIAILAELMRQALPEWPRLQQGALLGVVALIVGLIEFGVSYHQRFVIETRFGFNRMSRALFVSDALKSAVITLIVGAPLVFMMLEILTRAGALAWLWAWLVWAVFAVGALLAYPKLIAPWFNRFTPLPHGTLRTRIEGLLKRCGFQSGGVFVMDGSRRSAHGNAYFSGWGRAQRIVLFDTLIHQLSEEHLEAVLAHELGHFKHRHLLKRLGINLGLSLAWFAALAVLANQPWFYQGLGITPQAGEGRAGYALLLCLLIFPLASWLVQPLTNAWSRHQEFQADRFAAQHASADALEQALVRLYRDNAATLAPDPLYSWFFDTHPPALTRIARLRPHACAPAP